MCETQGVSQTLRQILLTLYYFILGSKIKKRKGNSSRAPVNPAVQFDSLILLLLIIITKKRIMKQGWSYLTIISLELIRCFVTCKSCRNRGAWAKFTLPTSKWELSCRLLFSPPRDKRRTKAELSLPGVTTSGAHLHYKASNRLHTFDPETGRDPVGTLQPSCPDSCTNSFCRFKPPRRINIEYHSKSVQRSETWRKGFKNTLNGTDGNIGQEI